jgi:transposase-like protein
MKAAEVDDPIKVAAQTIYRALIDTELTHVIGAGPWEHTATRAGLRNSRPRLLSTPAGDLELAIPRLRQGSFFPSLLERRRRVDQALYAVIIEAYLHGVSPARSTMWSRRWASIPASPSRRGRGLRRPGRRSRGVPGLLRRSLPTLYWRCCARCFRCPLHRPISFCRPRRDLGS